MLAPLIAASLQIAPAAGFGLAYGIAGAHLEGRYGRLGAFAGVGFTDLPDPAVFNAVATAAPVGGFRVYLADGDRLFLSAQAGWFSTRENTGSGSEFFASQRYVLAADVGYRVALGRLTTTSGGVGPLAWLEFAAGPGISFAHATGVGANGRPYDLGWKAHFGITEHAWLPDLSVGLGVDVF